MSNLSRRRDDGFRFDLLRSIVVLFFNNLEEVVKIYQLKLMRVMRIGDNWWVVIVSINV
jgi:hypothetical protein